MFPSCVQQLNTQQVEGRVLFELGAQPFIIHVLIMFILPSSRPICSQIMG
jgi:hypothetical protein